MRWRPVGLLFSVVGVGLFAPVVLAQAPAGLDINDLHEKAMKDAVRQVAPSVVQILTQGGTDLVVTGPKGPAFRKALGPTTGVIVAPDGYVISSAFNFINNPTTILVAVPGHKEPYLAKKIATDRSRMLTLLKIDAANLPVPQVVPRKDLQVGQWAIALGRTLDTNRDSPPSVSVGIISAVGRIWGKAVQTDAKVSPVNYGGPLVDILGRVQGILVPASPQGSDETAGYEWYDSGIGFAIPMEDVLAVVPRLQKGKDLNKGLLGVRLKSQDIYGGALEIADVTPDSAAARAGLKAGDVITEIDGHAVVRMAQVLHLIGPRYEGDKLALKYRRGKEEIHLPNLELVGTLSAYAHPYFGILPMRDDPKLGVEVRYVFAKTPAEAAGLKAGDRIVKYGQGDALQSFQGQKAGRNELLDFLNTVRPGAPLKLEVLRKDGNKTETISVTLDAMPGSKEGKEDLLPEKLPTTASREKALEPLEVGSGKSKPAKVDKADKVDKEEKKAETGLIKGTNPSGDHKYWLYVPDNYDPNVGHALVVWLHPPGQNKDEDVERFTETWSEYCAENHLILLGPQSDNESGWVPSDAEFVQEGVRSVFVRYTIDRQRVVAHGLGVGGQMAMYLGFHARDLVRGVATTGAVVTQPKDNVANQRLAFFLVAGDRDPLAKAIAESKAKLVERRFPVIHREIPEAGRQYLNERTLQELVRWIDVLDRL